VIVQEGVLTTDSSASGTMRACSPTRMANGKKGLKMRAAARPRISTAERSQKNREHRSMAQASRALNSSTLAFLPALLMVICFLGPSARCEPSHSDQGGPVVHVSSGQLRGALGGGTAVFLGIPYAAPPVGLLRWREPLPPNPWAGIRDATKPGSVCVQNEAGVGNFIKPLAAAYGTTYNIVPLSSSEDCLFLNVWIPDWPHQTHLPVMVWLHGGSNRVGSGTEDSYDGTALASHGVIVVTLNYRLGVLGFFAHPELTAESPHRSSGNYGLLDQIAALRWVQQNIAQFGGDPANVTLFGESAGSIDATVLMASPLTGNLFRRVIAESGTAFGLGPERSVAYMEPLGVAVGKAAGAQPGSQIEALRKLPAAQVAQIENSLIASQFKGYDPNASVVDGWVLPQSPAKAFASGAIEKVDLLAGLNAREFSAFRIGAEAAQKQSGHPAAKPGLGQQILQFADATRPLYGNWTDIAVATYMSKIIAHGAPALDQATNDILIACPVGAEAAMVTSAGQRAFVYRFERSVPGPGESTLGSFHALELPYVFDTFPAHTFSWLPFTSTDHKLSAVMQTYWTNFAKSGDPNGPGLPQWAAWHTDKEPYIVFSTNGDPVPQESFSPSFCHLSPDRLKQQLGSM
jgi:para-nitrobenzyl esterase